MPSTAGTLNLSDFPLNIRKPTGNAGAFTGEMGIEATINAHRLISTKPAARKQTLNEIIALAASGQLKVGEVGEWNEYHAGSGYGGHSAVLMDAGSSAARPSSDKGIIIHVGGGGLYLKGLFLDGLMSPNRWGADGTKSGDSAAVQAMIDAGVTVIEFEARPINYKVAGCVASTPVTFVGKPTIYGEKPTIEVDETALTIGTYSGQKINGFQTHRGYDIRIKGDIVGGIFDFRSCRNWKFDDTVQITSDQQYFIGCVVRSNRSYQGKMACRNFAKGFAMIEIGDTVGGEVMDTISLAGSITHGNIVAINRSGIFNCHNIDCSNLKAREFASSDEGTKTNNGVTYLSSSALAGTTTIEVNDASALKAGNLGQNDLIYVGVGVNAEYVRVSSRDGNAIHLDENTPLRFDHSNDHNASGTGEPVIFGAVFFTLESVRGFTSTSMHLESAFVGIHAKNLTGACLGHISNTCRHLIVNDSGGFGNEVASISGGNSGWPEAISLMTMFESADQSAFSAWSIRSRPDISANYTTQTDLTGGDIPFWALNDFSLKKVSNVQGGTTNVPSDCRKVHIKMDGFTNSIEIADGIFYKQPLTLSIDQNSQGARIVYALGSSINPLKPFQVSMSPFISDVMELEWNGLEWDEISRSPRITNQPYPTSSGGAMSDITNGINVYHKSQDLIVRNTANQHLYRASGPNPGDVWISLEDGSEFVPTGPV